MENILALLLATAGPWLRKYASITERVAGGLFVTAGIGLALSRRSF